VISGGAASGEAAAITCRAIFLFSVAAPKLYHRTNHNEGRTGVMERTLAELSAPVDIVGAKEGSKVLSCYHCSKGKQEQTLLRASCHSVSRQHLDCSDDMPTAGAATATEDCST
jgi:hypothetical protein